MQPLGGGKIVNISSVHATDAKRNFAHYSSSKAGLEMLTKCMALELAAVQYSSELDHRGRHWHRDDSAGSPGYRSAGGAGHRIGTADEIARLVAFLCSHSCDYMTGASIAVDGGLTLGFCASRPEL